MYSLFLSTCSSQACPPHPVTHSHHSCCFTFSPLPLHVTLNISVQASLLSKLSLGSVVIAQRSLYPLWFDALLMTGKHVLRARADLADLADHLEFATSATNSLAAEMIAREGRVRLCQLLHLPHLARYVAGLLQKYVSLFDGPHTSRLHRAVRRLADAAGGAAGEAGNRSLAAAPTPRTMLPERVWAELGGIPPHCNDIWWRDPRCTPAMS